MHYLAEQQPMVSIQSHYVCQATHAQELALLHGLVAEAARLCADRAYFDSWCRELPELNPRVAFYERVHDAPPNSPSSSPLW